VPPALNREGRALLRSARESLAGIEDKQQLVERLLTFVDEAIEDSNEIISPNLAYALEKQKGDCSEHAALFEALARAFEIPCRRVNGLVYMGDWAQSFGLHAWNEVVFEGHWHPVDVTRRAMQLPPFYIRFPLDSDKQDRLYAHIARMEIEVLKVEQATAN
jgi:transglutaminase-like putative cysteine protease